MEKISEELWNELKKNTLAGVVRLLESAERLLSSNGDAAICAGLYTYAFEEYGKLLLLNECIPLNGKVDINEEQLFRLHNPKFRVAIDRLPDECKHIGVDMWLPGMWQKGMFPDSSLVVADFKSRLAIFYCGLDASKHIIEPVPAVGKKNLEKAIEKLKTITFGFNGL